MRTQHCFRRRFASRHSAETAKYNMAMNLGKTVYVYPCERCSGYHLRTSS